MRGRAILFSEMTPAPEWEDKFNHWYDTEHIPIRVGLHGFVSAQRYRVADSLNYLAVYEMTDLAALRTAAYQAIKQNPSEETAWMLRNVTGFTRYLCEEISCAGDTAPQAIDTAVLYPVWFDVPQAHLQEFDDWYEQDHVPLLLECPQWRAVRRFDVKDGEPGRYNRLALHYLDDAAALESPARAKARATPWRERLAAQPWFKGTYGLFQRHGARQLPPL
ncbi:hypothetical protein PIGHUM_00637 [Pigmentiphaga humi]|uniref:EthD domain-containing protein n=1 Tax=Pigmentiphaga humi TaxID=2478468 RepID=A0A3P4AYQ6_9BURK|nr:DUF4286 family protein [Pigmentiphaga humi]VCU68580.1 hypothetical protein PIGHUM_00637 [Pigmentiphaga humi]